MPFCAPAQKRPSSGDQQMEVQLLSAALARVVQVTPSGDVITRLPVPLLATAAKRPSSGDQQTEFHILSALVCVVQVTPSGDVSALLPVPPDRTAQKRPSSGDQQMEATLGTINAEEVHVTPSGEVANELPPMMQKIPSCGDHAIEAHAKSGADLDSHRLPTAGDGVPPHPFACTGTTLAAPWALPLAVKPRSRAALISSPQWAGFSVLVLRGQERITTCRLRERSR